MSGMRPLLTLTLLCGLALPAAADELSRSDKLRVLYSNQFAFDRRGVPLITIGIVDGSREVTIESSAPIRVLPDGEDGSEVTGGKRWRVTIERAKAAQVDYFVVLARAPATQLERLRPEARRWRKRGARTQMIEVGALFGVKGRVFDNRAYLLLDGPYPSDEKARNAGERWAKQGLPRIAIVEQLKRRPSARLVATELKGGLRVRLRDAIWFAPAKGAKLAVQAARGKASVYWGQLYVTVDKTGRLAVVNAVPADRLLAGLVPAEIFSSAPQAALRGQAVAARTDLLAKIGTRHFADPFLICARVHCQVYLGAGKEHPRTTAAVKATKGQVLVRKDGSLVTTVYSAMCGGHTEDNDAVWPVEADPNLRGHLDGSDPALARYRRGIDDKNIVSWLASRPPTWCGRSSYNKDKYRWTTRIPRARLDKLVRELGVGQVRAIRVRRRGRSGRANLIAVQGTRGSREVRGEYRIRQLFGGLRSAMFVVRQEGDGFVFNGGGWGHGVGMCQTGATGMAQAGKTFRAILGHYYPGSELHALY